MRVSPSLPSHRWKKFIRLFTERGFASRAVRSRAYGVMRNRLGMAAPMLTEDRRVLEQIIFEHYRRDARIKTVLFVGCDSYTAHYQRRYFAGHRYWTIDPDPAVGRFGAKQHVVAPLQELSRHFPNGFFDLVMCNGVYGWGLDCAADCETALAQCHACLAEGGQMLLGWNDVPGRDPAPLSQIRSLRRFTPCSLPALGASRFLTDTLNRHTYCFYLK
jgi:SAM-dependent methyltransferase